MRQAYATGRINQISDLMRARVSRGVGLADTPKPYEATLERAVAAHGSDNGQASRPTCNVRTGCVWELCSHGKTWPTLRVAIQVRRFHPGISQKYTVAVPGILSHPLHQSQSRVAYTRYSSHDNTELLPICTFWEDKIKLLMRKWQVENAQNVRGSIQIHALQFTS